MYEADNVSDHAYPILRHQQRPDSTHYPRKIHSPDHSAKRQRTHPFSLYAQFQGINKYS